MRWVACFLGLLALATGCVLEDKPVDPQMDGSVDGGTCIDVDCPPNQPICTEELQCVQCTADDDAYCSERALVCNIASSTCVECLNDSNCTAADAARCDAKECAPCDDNAQCGNIDGLPSNANACDDGVCVDCTPENEAMTCPDGDSCNPVTNECSGIQDGSRLTCEICVSDRDCGEEGNRCVAMTYQGAPYPNMLTGFCLKAFTVGDPCERPYLVPLFGRESLSGPPEANFCGIDEANVTCPAVLALLNNIECPSGENSECPESGLCRDFVDGLAEDRCTYLCSDADECKKPPVAGSTCGVGSGGAGGAYCGG